MCTLKIHKDLPDRSELDTFNWVLSVCRALFFSRRSCSRDFVLLESDSSPAPNSRDFITLKLTEVRLEMKIIRDFIFFHYHMAILTVPLLNQLFILLQFVA